MKNISLIIAVLAIAIASSCTRKKAQNVIVNNLDYSSDMREALALESTPMPQNAVMMDLPEEVQANYNIYTGKIGEEGATLLWAPWNNRTEEDRANGVCGYLALDSNPRFRYILKEVSDEPNPNGYNKVVFDIYQGEQKKAVLEGIIEGRGDGFNGTVTFEGTGVKQDFSLMQQY